MRKLRLFHFDIKTFGNYGDTLLFECVRQLFNGFGGGQCFEIYESRPLRDRVGPALVRYINENVDAVVVGGGGLFLRDTNPNQHSGWQWNISLEMLRRIRKPLIIFAVGNNRFIDQADFSPPFHEHVNLTLEKSVFFGLRNTGSMETIAPYIAPSQRDRIEFQPCPTTISSHLFPDLWREEARDERRLGVQMVIGRRQAAAGFPPATIHRQVLNVTRRLSADGWSLDSVPHAVGDQVYARLAAQEKLPMREVRLFDDPDGLYHGVEYFAELPYILGTRGHAQMVPFGMGATPVSLLVHHKTGYFARDIGHPELAVDPRREGFEDRLYSTLRDVDDDRVALRKELTGVRERFYALTLDNLASIYRRLTGVDVEPSLVAYTAFDRSLAARAYAVSLSRARADQRIRELTDQVAAMREADEIPNVAGWLSARAKEAAATGDVGGARALLRAVESLAPDYFRHHARPRWASGVFRAIPAPLLAAAMRARAGQ